MIVFDFATIIESSVSALIFGLLFSFLYTLSALFFNAIYAFFFFLSKPNTTSNSEETDNILSKIKSTPLSIKVVFILLFGIGFTLLSYLTLDGIIRLYMIAISLFAFFLPERLLLQKFRSFLLTNITKLTVKIVNFFKKTTKFIKKCAKNRKIAKILPPNRKKHY